MSCCNFFGFSPAILAVKRMIHRVALTDFPVLIQGETGVGKEVVAEVIHCAGRRSRFPLVKVNCGGLTPTLISSELFGHIKGSFTDAKQDKLGKFTVADKGTLILDEVSSSSPALQAILLRVLERGEVEVIGQPMPAQVDVRVMSLSNLPLEQEVVEGRFRADLYHRLNVTCIQIPPLRRRKEDIPLFVQMFISENNNLLGRSIKDISKRALKLMMDYDWPGNIRELNNCIKRAFVLAEGDIIDLEGIDFGPSLQTTIPAVQDLNIRERCDMLERGLVLEALRRAGGNKAQASDLLGISPKNLSYYLKKHGQQGQGSD